MYKSIYIYIYIGQIRHILSLYIYTSGLPNARKLWLYKFPWSATEDMALITAHKNKNKKLKWIQLAKSFDGRTSIDLYNRWTLAMRMAILHPSSKPSHNNSISEQLYNYCQELHQKEPQQHKFKN